ncbi:MAG: septum formation initiator family protein [Lachnospiraceae bacterium]|nr:septum formation initiator family protein [Lachnospiraceae bacterium]
MTTRNNKPQRKDRRRRSPGANRAAMLGIIIVVCILSVVLFVKGHELKKQIIENDITKENLEAAIENEKARTEEIEGLKEYYDSEDYIRQIARDRLGLVEDGQIVFRSAN